NAAVAIGGRLVDEAIWHDGRCTWLGELTPEEAGGAEFGAIGPTIYDGTAGIALFLAQLHAETGIERFAAAARGAIRQSVRKLLDRPERWETGYYTGWTGIAVAAAKIGRAIGDDRLARDEPLGLFLLLSEAPRSPKPDLLSGTAGAVLAFLDLAGLSDDERFLRQAVELGDEVVSAAKRRGSSIWWPTDTGSGRRGLTGFAHGAAGIASALLALYSTTGEVRFRRAAEGAFAFERRNFSPLLGNWLDLRYQVNGTRFGPGAVAADAWCHGSGGILLSRLLAWKLLKDGRYLDEVDLAIQSLLSWFASEPAGSPARWCLCHGFAGNADILLTAATLLPKDAGGLRELARNVGDAGLEIDQSKLKLGLMLGLAGLGYYYLRLASPIVPSPLVPWSIGPDLLG
ncbi:MAG TPA: lanthionine synthetase LanC family protein, partial [Thermomicrobiaceae bacterium]|nr:lanthionine synthetase LanC family protein [Thermomicrobiaceae bacterium]